MAYDEALAERIRGALAGRDDVTERTMIGGIAFMVGGRMAVGVVGADLMVRVVTPSRGRTRGRWTSPGAADARLRLCRPCRCRRRPGG